MKKILYTLFALWGLASCSQESSLVTEVGEGSPREMVLWSNVGELNAEVATRAADPTGQVDNTKATNLYFARQDKNITGSDVYPGYGSSTILAATRTAASGTAASAVTFTAPQYYCMEKPFDKTATNVYRSSKLVGWFPQGSLAAGKVTIVMDGNTDIMLSDEKECSYTDQLNSSDKAFQFKHLLTYYKVQVKALDAGASESWGAVTNVASAYQFGRKCEITLPDKVFFPPTYTESAPLDLIGSPTVTAPVTLEYNKAKDVGASFRVPAVGALPLVVTTEKGGVRAVSVINGEEGFQAGKSYTITLEFKSTAITPSTTISGWVSSGSNTSVDL